MRKRSWTTAVVIGLFVVGMTWPANRSTAQSNTIAIHIHSNGEVDNELVNLSKAAGDRVVWYSDGGDFTITFSVTPFGQDTFHVPAGGSVGSGALRSSAGIGEYPYLVSADSGGGGMDPGVAVKP